MSDFNRINGPDLDRWITGNYGEDQYNGLIECPSCGTWFDPDLLITPECAECGEALAIVADDPDRKRDEAREA